MKLTPLKSAMASLLLSLAPSAQAEPLQIGQPAPQFQVKRHDGGDFKLADRLGKGWTVLYFYPKAGTPGCTTQACAFRDAIQVVRNQNAEVFGISTDGIEALKDFHTKYKLNFDLLSDLDAKVTEAYGVKFPVLKLAKRWTFILDPELVVRHINDKVDPALDAKEVAETLKHLQQDGR
jgi:peroxiredoxin Q/BCP